MDLFLVPYVLLAVACGTAGACRFLGRREAWGIAVAVAFALLQTPGPAALSFLARGWEVEDVPAAIRFLEGEYARRPDIPLLVTGPAIHAFRYYTQHDSATAPGWRALPMPPVPALLDANVPDGPEKIAAAVRQGMGGAARVWLLYSHLRPEEAAALRAAVGGAARIVQSREEVGAGALLLERAAP